MLSADNQILLVIMHQISDMRRENAEFRRDMLQELKDFKAETNTRFSAVDTRFDAVDARFDRLEAQMSVMQNDITGLKHDVSNLYTWNYWTLSIILALAAMPHVVAGIKSLFGAIADGISLIAGAFRRGK